jgi:hypothetical protein
MANITGGMPKPIHEKAKARLQDICPFRHASMPCRVIDGGNKKAAVVAFDPFVEPVWHLQNPDCNRPHLYQRWHNPCNKANLNQR